MLSAATILAVDDNQDNLFVLRELVGQMMPDCRLLTARSAEEGLEVAAGQAIDVIVIDVQMPGVDGIELCRRLKANAATAHVPLVLITAHKSTPQLRTGGLEAGADDFISRPIDNLELIARLRVMLRIKRAEDDLRKMNVRLEELVARRTQALKEERDFAAAVLDTVEALVAILDPDGRIVRLNPSFERITGHTSAAAVGKPFWELFSETDEAGVVRENFERLQARHQTCAYESDWRVRSDERRTIAWVNRGLFRPDGTLRYVISTGIDITERCRAEEAKSELRKQVLHIQKMEAIGQLAGGVAHDFNNCLTAILGNVELIKDMLTAGSEVLSGLAIIEEAAQQAAGVARSLLTFSRRLPSQKKAIRLGRLVDTGLRMVRRMLPPSVQLVSEVDREGESWVVADTTQIQQVVMNLAINARDAMPEGGTLRIAVLPAEITQFPELGEGRQPTAGWISLSIADTGTGIPEDIRGRIFEPFFTSKTGGHGTGLGLSIVRSIVEDHGGRIRVSSEVGKGSTFTVLLPCVKAAVADVAAGSPQAGLQGAGETIIIAENNPFIRQLLARTLDTVGYKTVQIDDGPGLLDAVRAREPETRLIIMDLELPQKNGQECLRTLRDTGLIVPIIMMTGRLDADLEDRLGEDVILLRKPFQLADLSRLVRMVLASSEPIESDLS